MTEISEEAIRVILERDMACNGFQTAKQDIINQFVLDMIEYDAQKIFDDEEDVLYEQELSTKRFFAVCRGEYI